MGEDVPNVGSGLIREQGQRRWQTTWGQSAPPAHRFIDYETGALYDLVCLATRAEGLSGVCETMAAHLPAGLAELESWPPVVRADAVLTLADSPPSWAWPSPPAQ